MKKLLFDMLNNEWLESKVSTMILYLNNQFIKPYLLMHAPKILIVEDDLLMAADIADMLNAEGYEISGNVTNALDAMESFKKHQPDLVIMDIELEGEVDGIELAAKMNNHAPVGILYLTDQKDPRTIERAENIHHSLYIEKPYGLAHFCSQVKLALKHFSGTKSDVHYLFLKKDHNSNQKSKVLFDDIVYLHAERSYCNIFIAGSNPLEKIMVSEPMQDILKKLDATNFIRVHRSYAVNLNFIESYDRADIVMHLETPVPIGEMYKQSFLERIGQA
jgi:DNA-binding LytR/AlgR family response regulator